MDFIGCGNSAFTLLIATILPLYFGHLAEAGGLTDVQYLACWGYAASIATFINALIGPTVGALADYLGYKKPLFAASLILGVAALVPPVPPGPRPLPQSRQTHRFVNQNSRPIGGCFFNSF